MTFRDSIFFIIFVVLFFLSIVTDYYDFLVYSSTVAAILMMLDKMGRGIVLREIIALFNVFTCLFMPLIGYLVYNRTDPLALAFVRYMPVPKYEYFSYALPAVNGFVMAICMPLRDRWGSDYGNGLRLMIASCKSYLVGNQSIGIILVAIGLLSVQIRAFMPSGLQYLFMLFYFSSFSGILYIFFSKDFPFKKIILSSFFFFIVYGAIQNSMFTIFAYMGMTIFSFFVFGLSRSLFSKFLIFVFASILLLAIQSVKSEYRADVLKKGKEDKFKEFVSLISVRLNDLGGGIKAKHFFLIHYRTNQGFYVGLVMKRFPSMYPFDYGEYIGKVNVSSFVPRFLWPDKPKAGGYENMKHFTGIILKGYTNNVGPLGEAWGSFGLEGGVVFMIFLGFFIRFTYILVFKFAKRYPLLIFWIPILYYQVTYSAENDTLQITNSLVKGAIFIYILFKSVPQIFRPSIKPLN